LTNKQEIKYQKITSNTNAERLSSSLTISPVIACPPKKRNGRGNPKRDVILYINKDKHQITDPERANEIKVKSRLLFFGFKNNNSIIPSYAS
jgi:hypothetical protein